MQAIDVRGTLLFKLFANYTFRRFQIFIFQFTLVTLSYFSQKFFLRYIQKKTNNIHHNVQKHSYYILKIYEHSLLYILQRIARQFLILITK
jgi:hypothetical protein